MTIFSSIPDALEDIKHGKLIILIDNPDRENEGDFFVPAQLITPEKVNFLVKNGRGLVCVAMDKSQAKRLALSPMVPLHRNTETTKVNFTVSVNAKHGITSGISAYDRAKTILTLTNPDSAPEDITKPGHVFPLIAHDQGLSARQGHTEAAVTLSRLADLNPAGVICEILKDDGRMAKLPDLMQIAKKFDLKLVSIADLQRYEQSDPASNTEYVPITMAAKAQLPTRYGLFDLYVYRSSDDDLEHCALVMGDIIKAPVLTRIHSQCLTGDTFGSLLCDCGEQLHRSLELIQKKGSGILLYLNQEGRGIGLENKILAYAKQKAGLDTVEANLELGFRADERDYTIAADILQDLGIKEIELLTNNPEKADTLQQNNIRVLQRLPLETEPTDHNRHYLTTKKRRLGHQLNLV